MADRRRRKLNEDSDIGTDESGDENVVKCKSDGGSEGGNSEYESVDEDEYEGEEREEGESSPLDGKEDEKALDDDEDRKNPQYIPKKGTFYEHDDRTVGEDEGGEEKEPVATPQPEKKEIKKKMWKEDGDSWQHDRFSAFDQTPKSKEELVIAYGYDIRNEEGPPRARRRRRYGRGPNKYTRNWEDLDAYARPTKRGGGVGVVSRVATRGAYERGPRTRGRGRGGSSTRSPKGQDIYSEEEFPALTSRDSTVPRDNFNEQEINNPQSISVTISNEKHTPHNYQGDNSPATVYSMPEERRRDNNRQVRGAALLSNKSNIKNRGRGIRKPYPRQMEEIGMSNGRQRLDNSKEGRGGRGGSANTYHKPNRGSLSNANHSQRDIHEVTNEIKSMTIHSQKEEFHFKGKRGSDPRRGTIPPRLQESHRGGKNPPGSSHGDATTVGASPKPKRYSSQRQRTMQDQNLSYQNQGYFDQGNNEHNFQNNIYENTSNQNKVNRAVVPAHSPPQPTAPGSSAPPTFVAPTFPPATPPFNNQQFLSRPPAPRPSQQMLAASVPGPALATNAVAAAPLPPPPTVTPVTGPPFLPADNMINFAAGVVPAPHPQQFPPPPPFQAFTPVTQPEPQEIYSNGVMYYNTQSQQQVPRIIQPLQKRPKAAIPIIPPPDREMSLEEASKYAEQEYQLYHESQQYATEEEILEGCYVEAPTYITEAVVESQDDPQSKTPTYITQSQDDPQSKTPTYITQSQDDPQSKTPTYITQSQDDPQSKTPIYITQSQDDPHSKTPIYITQSQDDPQSKTPIYITQSQDDPQSTDISECDLPSTRETEPIPERSSDTRPIVQEEPLVSEKSVVDSSSNADVTVSNNDTNDSKEEIKDSELASDHPT